MTGIFFIAIAIAWVIVVIVIARWIASRFNSLPTKVGSVLLSIPILSIAPVADELAGGQQFKSLCRRDATLQINVQKIRGKTVKRIDEQIFRTDTLLPTEMWVSRLTDALTGENYGQIAWLRTRGGWLVRTLGFIPGDHPLLISPATCWPAMTDRPEEAYSFHLLS